MLSLSSLCLAIDPRGFFVVVVQFMVLLVTFMFKFRINFEGFFLYEM